MMLWCCMCDLTVLQWMDAIDVKQGTCRDDDDGDKSVN